MQKTAEKTKTAKKPAKTGDFYELYMLLSPSSIDKNLSGLEKEMEDILKNNEAEVSKKDKVSKKNLAYPIAGFESAYSGSIYFYSKPNQIENIKEEIKDTDVDFLRVIIVKTEPKRVKKRSAVKERDLEKITEKLETVTKEKVGTSVESEQMSTEKPKEEKEVSIDDIDKKLDEIMGSL